MKQGRAPKILFGLLAALIVFCVAAQILSAAFNPIETVTALDTTVEDSVAAEGFFLRDEVVVGDLQDGHAAEYLVEEGDKVSSGQRIAVEYGDESAVDTIRQMEQLQQRIELLQQTLEESADVLDTSKVDQMIANQQTQISALLSRGEVDALQDSLLELRSLALQRSYSYSEDEQLEQELSTARAEYESLSNQVGNLTKTIYAPCAGVFSATVDGYEQELALSRLADLTAEDIQALLEEDETAPDTNAGKIAQGFSWYFAVVLPEERGDFVQAGQAVQLRFGKLSESALDATVYDVRPSQSGSHLVIFQGDTNLGDLLALRRQSVDIIRETYQGIKVPVDALRMEEDQRGVYILSGNRALFRPVELIYEADNYVLVRTGGNTVTNTVFPQDEVIVRAKEIEDKKVVK